VEDKRERTKPTFEESKQTLEQAVQQELLEAKIAELRKDSKVELLLTPEAPADAPKAEPVD
jgi:parvulin-like peptidyl-prolyl isomerase